MEEELREARRVKILLGIIVALLAIIVISIIFYIRGTRTMTQAQKEAVEIAQTSAKLDTVDQFYWFTRKETYFTVTGTDENGTDVAVIIPKSGAEIVVLNQKDGVNEEQIRQIVATDYQDSTIQKVNLGLFDGKPTWEVVTKNSEGALTYYLLSFEEAKEISIIRDI